MQNPNSKHNGMDKEKKKLIIMPSVNGTNSGAPQTPPLSKPATKKHDNGNPKDAVYALALAQKNIVERFPDIINGLIEAAIKGGHLPARLLMDLAGIVPAPPEDPADEREESLAQMMLHE